jgi:hypothetical protein
MVLLNCLKVFRFLFRLVLISALIALMIIILVYSSYIIYYITDERFFDSQYYLKVFIQYYILLVIKYLYNIDYLKDIILYLFRILELDLTFFDGLKYFRKPSPFIDKADLPLFEILFPGYSAYDAVFIYIIYLTSFYILKIMFKFYTSVDVNLKKHFVILRKLDSIFKAIVNFIHFFFIILGLFNVIYNPYCTG